MRRAWMAGLAATIVSAVQPVPFGRAQAVAVPAGAMPAKPPVVLVELFTSEGCSSCPPADELLQGIDGKRTSQGTLIVGLSEHVTYWDHNGWKDPFGSDLATDRQSEYGRRFALDSVYTPQMVINGETQFVGSDGTALNKALDTARIVSQMAVTIASLKTNGDTAEVTVVVSGKLPARGAEIFAVVAEDETTAHVLRGENSGRTLSHASVARALVRVGKVKAAGASMVRMKLPPADAGSRRHYVVWVQEAGLGRVLDADSRAF